MHTNYHKKTGAFTSSARFIIILGIVCVIAAISILLLTTDWNTYKADSKTVTAPETGIIFSITTYDGATESRPFVQCMGHAWLSIDNATDASIFLGETEIAPGETLTFAAWAIRGHAGIYYNMEPNFIRDFDRYNGRLSLSTQISAAQLDTIVAYLTANDYWTPTRNCSYTAIHLWNAVVSEDLQLPTQTIVYTPTRLQDALLEFDCVERNRDFTNAGSIFYYDHGVRTELTLCQ